jgi:hypothetical protein
MNFRPTQSDVAAPQEVGFFDQVFRTIGEPGDAAFGEAAGRLVVAGLLGAVVAGSYLFSTRRRSRTPGLAGTLVLLAMLIAFVSLAIGNNAAKAFTLVGTLAIVRFRTPVRDIRDTAFVIFAVAVGIAVGALHPTAALAGTVVVGLATAIVAVGRPNGQDETLPIEGSGRLNLRCDVPPASLQRTVEPLIAAHARAFRLVEFRDGRDGGARVLYAVDVDRTKASELIAALQAVAGVSRATLSFGDVADDDA